MSHELEKIKSYCENCENLNNHVILFEKKIQSGEREYNYAEKYLTIQCMGCEAIRFRKEFHDYEASYPDEDDNWVHDITIDLFPW